MATLQKLYKDTLAGELQKQLGCNAMAVPRVTKITLNMGLGAVSYTHLTLPTKRIV